MGKFINRVGMRYGRLTVVSLNAEKTIRGERGYSYYWDCICDCGNKIIVSGKELSTKQRESCGCLHRERISRARKGKNIKYKDIPKFNTEKDALSYLYHITNDGRIFSRCDGRELSSSNGPKGYRYIRLKNPQFSTNKDGRKPYKVHRLVAMFYLSDYSESLQVNHKNGDKRDNRVENLEMVNNSQNALHAWKCLDRDGRRRQRTSKWGKDVTKDKCVPVVQIKDGKVISIFPSITSASKAVDARKTDIWQCLHHPTRTCKGFHWRRK